MERTLYVAQKGNAVKWTIPKRELEPNQVRVQIHSVAINPIDWKTIDNNLADGAGQGNDFAGTVVEVGSEVKNTKVGDTVAGGVGGGDVDKKENGAFTDLLSVEEHLLFKFPHKLDEAKSDEIPSGVPTTFEQAASLGIAADTNVIAFDGHDKPGPNDWALIFGVTSSLGFVAAQFARNLGYKVIGVSGKVPAALEPLDKVLEGVHWIDRSTNWVDEARRISGDRIVFAYDTIGLDDSANQVFRTLSKQTKSLGAFSSPGIGPEEHVAASNSNGQVRYPLYFFLMQEVKKFGTTGIPDKDGYIERAPELVTKINAQLAKNQLKSLPIKVLNGLDQVNAGLDLSRKGVRATKVVIRA